MNKNFYLSSRITKPLLVLFVFCFVAISSEVSAQYQYQGSRYYYNILGTHNHGAQSQALYDYLVAQADALHTDFTTTYTGDTYVTVNIDGFGFPKNGWNGINYYYELDVIGAIDNTFVAFFQDNVQYFMIETNVGLTVNGEYTLHFEAPSTQQTTHLYDYRLPADRRAHMDMVDSAFAKYTQLTQNATSRYEKARLIHDKIVSDWDYATNTFSPGAHDLMGPIGYAPDGIVCEAYSKMFAFMATNLGVPALFVPGDMVANDGFPAGGHAWNLAEMDDGNYYFLDLTWVDNQRTNLDAGNFRNPLNYNWFLRGHDNNVFESKHYAGPGSFLTVYVNPANLGGPDYDYKNIYSNYKFLGDIQADRSQEFNLGTYHLPAVGASLNIQPPYYNASPQLIYGTDYEIEFEQPLRLGKNRVWFKGKGNYRGLDFGVVHLIASSATIPLTIALPSETYEYTGSAITPIPTVKNGAVTLVQGQDYTVSYQNNVNLGTAKMIITGLGRYAGTVYEKNFQIIIVSSGTQISAANFEAIFPTVANVLVVIKQQSGNVNVQQQQQNALTLIQNAANYYGIEVYYIDWSSSITSYNFYNTIMGAFAGIGVDYIYRYPVLAAVRNASSFCVDAFEKHVTAGGGGYEYGLIDEEAIRNMIVNCIDISYTEIKPVEQTQSLQVSIRGNKLHISGLTADGTGKVWAVYNIMGKLVHQATAVRNEEEVALPTRGVYLINYGNSTVKVMY